MNLLLQDPYKMNPNYAPPDEEEGDKLEEGTGRDVQEWEAQEGEAREEVQDLHQQGVGSHTGYYTVHKSSQHHDT